MLSETEWVLERMRLYDLTRTHPTWSLRQYARQLGHDVKWVSKWLGRIKTASSVTMEVFKSKSRAPKTIYRRIEEKAKEIVCDLRQQLSLKFHRNAGAKTILWGLAEYLKGHPVTFPLPKSRSTITQILRERGWILPPRPVSHEPLELPAPMEEWEIDFAEIWLRDEGVFEFFVVVDRGTSRLVYIEGSAGYNTETTLEAMARLFILCGLPKRIRFDRDVRLWGAWTRDSYPSPFIRFLRVLGIIDVVCPPRRPDLKPFVERCIQTIKYEWFARQYPSSFSEAKALLEEFPYYYNDERPHQGKACGNRPPSVAFPNLPLLPQLPEKVRPDHWLKSVHGHIYRRRVNSNGTIQVDRHSYSIGTFYAKQPILVHVDAHERVFKLTSEGHKIKQLPILGLFNEMMSFWDYFRVIQTEARLVELHHAALWERRNDSL